MSSFKYRMGPVSEGHARKVHTTGYRTADKPEKQNIRHSSTWPTVPSTEKNRQVEGYRCYDIDNDTMLSCFLVLVFRKSHGQGCAIGMILVIIMCHREVL